MRVYCDDQTGGDSHCFRDFNEKRFDTLVHAVKRKYQLEYSEERINEKEFKSQKLIRGKQVITIQWEFLAGLIVISPTKQLNPLVLEMSEFIAHKYL